ncbi:MAG TPA: cytidylate kinase family protein [Candidatus Bathyarchaeia archaeon]|nr:cytidylate kinase family protein [Candidatus Bathyarchaeia archaeon]
MVVITLSGPHGSGKSTYAKAIAKALNLRYVSSGQTFRRLAKESSCDLESFSKQCEKNKEIDKEIDQITINEAKEGNVILEGQLAAWMTKDFSDFNIFVTASLAARIKRIAARDGVSFEEAKKETKIRTKSEINRFKRLYKIDIENQDIYDLILSTDRLSKKFCTEILINICKEIIEKASL